MFITTLAWGRVDADTITHAKCPVCQRVFWARISGDTKKLELPGHGSLSKNWDDTMECRGGAKWYHRPGVEQP